jgi:predicted DNA-binding antitoxin AbrB/MazE fold protein
MREARTVKATYDGKVFKPAESLDLPKGSDVTLLVILQEKTGEKVARKQERLSIEDFRGILAHVKEDSVTLQHKIKEEWADRYDAHRH